MSTAYWNQFSYGELMSMQGVEIDDLHNKTCELDYNDVCDDGDKSEEEFDEDEPSYCPCCSGGGCSYCYMCE